MEVVLTEWLSAVLRWLHVIAGIAWIGSSFYFIHLDLSLKTRGGLPDGVKGEAWQVHGGGFYQMIKFLVAPAKMPDELTWFKWEAYATWLSGFALLVLVYYLNADLFLIDKSVLDMGAKQAAAIAFLSLAAAWLAYEGLCRSPLGKHEVALALVGYVFLVALTYGFTHVFSGRGAFTQIGALIGTIMVANVFVIIIPYQKKTVAALIAGKEPDPIWGALGKQRSVHNNYLTLPVVFLMLTNHYPLFFATKYNWLIVAIVLLIGPVIRHYFNARHEGKGRPWWTWAVAAAGMLAIAWLSGCGRRRQDGRVAGNAEICRGAGDRHVPLQHVPCRRSRFGPGLPPRPTGIRLDDAEQIKPACQADRAQRGALHAPCRRATSPRSARGTAGARRLDRRRRACGMTAGRAELAHIGVSKRASWRLIWAQPA